MRVRLSAGLMLGCMLLAGTGAVAAPWANTQDTARVSNDLASLFDEAAVRYPGRPGNLAIERRIDTLFAESGLPHGSMQFQAPAFVPGKTRLTLDSGTAMDLMPMHPSLIRPGNFEERSFSASLVYLGDGSVTALAAVKGIDMNGAIAVMEFGCGKRWHQLLRHGVKGFIFLGAERYYHKDLTAKVYPTETRVPRFYAAPDDAALLRKTLGGSRPVAQGKLEAEPSRWKHATLRNLWVLVPGADPDLSKEVVVITAPMDANCVVPELAVGAQNGANLYLLTRLLEDFSKAPPARSVLLAAVNAHTQHYRGDRVFSWNLLVPRPRLEAVQDVIATDLRVQEMYIDRYSKFDLDPPTKEDAEYIRELRGLTDASTGRHLAVKEPIVNLAKRDVNLRRAEQIKLHRADIPEAERKAKSKAMEQERQKFVNVLTLFNKVGIKTEMEELNDVEMEILRGYVDTVIRRNQRWAELNRRELSVNTANAEIREALEGRDVKFVITLNYAWSNPRIGFSSGDMWGAQNWQHRWGANAARIAESLSPAGTPEAESEPPDADGNLFVDTMTRRGGLPEAHFFMSSSLGLSLYQAADNMPAFAARNAYTGAGRAFSPNDTFDRLDIDKVAEVVNFSRSLFRAVLDDRNITNPSELRRPRLRETWTVQIKTFKFDEFSASVLPELPVPDSFVLMYASFGSLYYDPIYDGDVITAYFAMTDERAAATFYGVSEYADLPSNAFHLDSDFTRIDHTVDAGEAEAKVSSQIRKRTDSARLALFNCYEFPVHARHDSSVISMDPILTTDYRLLSGRQDAAPKKYGMSGAVSILSAKLLPQMEGPASFFFEPSLRVKILTKDDILALNSSLKRPQGIGYASSEELGPDFFAAAAEDMSLLNHDRLKKLRGVSDELAREFLDRGDKALAAMKKARAADDHLAYLEKLYEAVGAQFKAYTQESSITNDMLKAVVFYLALMLPFCFFVQKLMFKFVKIELQMLAFGGLFVGTFLVFRTIHPAFRIAEAPAAMFIAFVMGGLGAFVIKILHGRFEGEMQLLFNTYAAMDTSEVGYSTVGQEAMLIGVNNMKRRRLRTTFTTATIVLVTFTMLAFTSISKKLSPTLMMRSEEVPYTGLMYHWPGNSCMDEGTTRILRECFAKQGDVVVRRWLLGRRKSMGYNLPIPDGMLYKDQTVTVDAALGLSLKEDGFLGPIPLTAGRFFSSDEAEEVILPTALAEALGIDPDDFEGQAVEFRGRSLEIVGILDDEKFKALKDLNQRPILPIKSLLEQAEEEAGTDMAAAKDRPPEESGVFFAEMSSLLLIPVETARRFEAEPYSVSVRLNDKKAVWKAVDRLLTVTRATKFHMGSLLPFSVGDSKADSENAVEPGVYYIGEGYRTSIGGLSFLIIPLLIASTIILNTMLGSVYERKSEIAVYNAVGLNPTHIGMFFLAESFVYSVIGSVGGYLIGQVLSILLTKTGVISEVNLNFSSLSVVYVILFTVAVVLLSTIYPSMVATKAAVPSGKRKWSIPENDGQTMNVVFPFIYQEDLILGILGYLESYFSQFTEASFGDIIALLEDKQIGKDAKGRDTYRMKYHLALAPFDLGVTQTGIFSAAYDDRVQAYRIALKLDRLSGQDTNWLTTNKPFLERLRTYLMHWRNLDASEHALNVQRGKELFGLTQSARTGNASS